MAVAAVGLLHAVLAAGACYLRPRQLEQCFLALSTCLHPLLVALPCASHAGHAAAAAIAAAAAALQALHSTVEAAPGLAERLAEHPRVALAAGESAIK